MQLVLRAQLPPQVRSKLSDPWWYNASAASDNKVKIKMVSAKIFAMFCTIDTCFNQGPTPCCSCKTFHTIYQTIFLQVDKRKIRSDPSNWKKNYEINKERKETETTLKFDFISQFKLQEICLSVCWKQKQFLFSILLWLSYWWSFSLRTWWRSLSL